MSATFVLTAAYPDCPRCASEVDAVKHESIDDERRFDTEPRIHAKGNPYVLHPCGHKMYGCLVADDSQGCRITQWYETTEHADISWAMGER